MNKIGLHCTGATVALWMLTACGNGSSVTPLSEAVNGGYVGTSAVAVAGANVKLHATPGYPSIVPDVKAKSKYYEYIINDYYTYAGIFDYPKSTKAIGYINDVGGQGCTNVLYGYGKKTFWIVAAYDNIAEYSVPHKKLRALSDNIGAPSSCAMNTNGDLAVGILYGTDGGDVVVYKDAKGSGTAYPTSLAREYFDGYDPKGNLFADGFTGGSNFELIELAKGSNKFVTVSTSNTVEFPGSVQWDGKYLDVTDQIANAIYQYTVTGTQAKLKGTVRLSGSSDCAQTWIATGVVYCADAGLNGGEVFKYPAGGSPIATFSGKFDVPLGTVAAQQ